MPLHYFYSMPVSPRWFLDVRLEGPTHHGNSEVGFEMESGIQLICRLGALPAVVTLCVFLYAGNENSASLRFLPGLMTKITAEPEVPWLI